MGSGMGSGNMRYVPSDWRQGGVCAYEVKQRVALVRVSFFSINYLPPVSRNISGTERDYSYSMIRLLRRVGVGKREGRGRKERERGNTSVWIFYCFPPTPQQLFVRGIMCEMIDCNCHPASVHTRARRGKGWRGSTQKWRRIITLVRQALALTAPAPGSNQPAGPRETERASRSR
jgi:hypothetical protein